MARIVGTWHIIEMELWDEDYFNMEVQAFITIASNGTGSFQFGLVGGGLDGTFDTSEQNFQFEWEGFSEMDECFGEGWIALSSEGESAEDDEAEGTISLEYGDSSRFKAVRAS